MGMTEVRICSHNYLKYFVFSENIEIFMRY